MSAEDNLPLGNASPLARFESVGLDLRYSLRSLRRSPAFTGVAVLTLALGVAFVTAMFSVVDAVLFRGLPYRSPRTLQTVYERSDDGKLRVPSYPTFKDWQTASASVSDAIEGLAFVRGDGVLVPGTDGPEQKISAYVTPGFFTLLGTRPQVGRTFAPDEEVIGAPPVAVISHELFMTRFGGDPAAAIGKLIAIDSIPTTIVGVMPRGFAYPNFGGSPGWLPPAFWQPIPLFEATHNALNLRGLHVDSRAAMRLRQGVDSARASAAMRTIQLRLASDYPVEQAHWTSVMFRPFGDELFGELRSTLTLLSGAIAVVLLLACANVANLFLVRAGSRARELALRSVLGAGRWRIARQLAVEIAVVAGAAGTIGAALAYALLGFVRQFAVNRLPFATDMVVNGRALAFALGAATLTALLVGILPALYASRTAGRLMERLRSGATASVGSSGERRARNALVSLQFALAFTLLLGAGLLIQSVRQVLSASLGYDPSNLVNFDIAPGKKYDAPADAAALYRRVLDELHAIPGVEMAAVAGGALLPTKVEPVGQPTDGPPLLALYHPVSAEYQRVLRFPLVEGRWFTDDDMRSPAGFVINQSLAKRLFPGASAIGKPITTYRASQARADFGRPITLPVVGVVGDMRQFGRESNPDPELFLPYTLEVWPWMNFVLRAQNPTRVLAAVDSAVRAVDPAVNQRGKASVAQAGLTSTRRFVTSLLTAFAASALLLAATGLYGIVAYGVVQRTREVGIRIALGATPRSIVALVLRDGARYAIGGAVLGLFGAFATTRLLTSMLYETKATDPATFVAVPIVLAMVALLASYVPARRAARTDPLVAIRSD